MTKRSVAKFVASHALAFACVLAPVIFGWGVANFAITRLVNGDVDKQIKVADTKAPETKPTLFYKLRPSAAKQDSPAPAGRQEGATAPQPAGAPKGPTVEPDRQIYLLALHLAGRYGYAVATAFIFFLSVIAFAVGLGVLFRAGWLAMVTVTALSLVAGAGIGHEIVSLDLGRVLLVDNILKAADAVDILAPLKSGAGTDGFVANLIGFNMGAGIFGVGMLLGALCLVSIQDPNPVRAELKHRLSVMRIVLGIGSAILVVNILAGRSLLDWTLSLLVEPQKAALKPLADALLMQWGASGTLTLFAAVIPALVAWWIDVGRFRANEAQNGAAQAQKHQAHKKATAEAAKDSAVAKSDKPADDGLELAPMPAIVSLIAALAPLLASPFVDGLKGIIGAVGAK